MTKQPKLVSATFAPGTSELEIRAWIDTALFINPRLEPVVIRVSNTLHQRTINGHHKGIRIAMEPSFYPDDIVEIEFGPWLGPKGNNGG